MSHLQRLQQIVGQLQPSVEAATAIPTCTTQNTASSSSNIYDVIIVGVGAMGVSSAMHLAKAGKKVLGLERYTIAHANGSSHGETRITRLAYWEHPDYVPLLRRSFELFRELESASGQKLFYQTGSLDIGSQDEATFAGSLLSCQTHQLEHEVFTPEQLAARFPAWRIPSNYRACFQPAGGMLFPEKVVEATAKLARSYGAILKEQVEVADIAVREDGIVIVRTTADEVFHGRHVILSPGAWLPTLIAKTSLGQQSARLRSIGQLLKPERQVVSWYSTRSGTDHKFEPEQFPVWVATFKKAHYYGFPLLKGASPGVKIGRYHHAFEQLSTEESLNNLAVRQTTTDKDHMLYTDEFMKVMFGGDVLTDNVPILKMSTCIFTNTPDEHFIVDPHPDPAMPQVSLISACSGHGFKFSSVLGEIMADFLLTSPEQVEKRLPIKWLDAGRLLGDRPPLQVLDPHMEMTKKKI